MNISEINGHVVGKRANVTCAAKNSLMAHLESVSLVGKKINNADSAIGKPCASKSLSITATNALVVAKMSHTFSPSITSIKMVESGARMESRRLARCFGGSLIWGSQTISDCCAGIAIAPGAFMVNALTKRGKDRNVARSHLPISAYARLETLRRLKGLREAKGLSAGQDAAADVVFASKGPGGLNRLRGQAIAELVASGYLLEEIMMLLADPESPYSILIEGLKPESIHDTIRAIVRDTKAVRRKQGADAARNDFIQHLHRLRDAAWAALDESGVSHAKNLLDSIEKYGQAIAEAEGVRLVRAGRGSTKHTEPEEQSEDEDEAPAGTAQEDPKWEEEYHTDESDD